MKATTYYADKFPAHLLVNYEGEWYTTKISPFRKIGEDELKPLAAPKTCIEAIRKSEVMTSIARFYGLD